jgi:hypothetical protein
MTTENFTRYIAEIGDSNLSHEVDEEAVKELSQLISGSLVYRLYEALDRMDFDLASRRAFRGSKTVDCGRTAATFPRPATSYSLIESRTAALTMWASSNPSKARLSTPLRATPPIP